MNQKSDPPKNQAWGGFWRAIIALVIGFLLPVLGCSGLVLVSVVSLQAASLAASPSAAPRIRGPATGPAVGVIRAEGVLQTGSDPLDYASVTSSEDLVELIDQAAADSDIRAVVLAVNSPGGSVVASDVIHHALQGLDRPVVVVMGKVGVDFVVITSGPRKDFGSPYREMTAAERRYWQSMVDEIYDGFVQVVVQGRGLAEEEVREIADGSVYTGRRALDLGLIDG